MSNSSIGKNAVGTYLEDKIENFLSASELRGKISASQPKE